MKDLKNTYSMVFLKAADIENKKEDLENFKKKWWYNNRKKNTGGLRLTEDGINFVKSICHLKTYSIDFPKELIVTPQILLWLDNFIDSPYYIDKKSITVIKEKSAFELYLLSGDIKKLGYTRALSKKFCQNQHQ